MGLRVVLMGTGAFALPPFRAVLESDHQVVATVTQPERSGRGHHRHVNEVRVLAESFGVPVLQPDRVNHGEVLQQLRSFEADLFLVAAYGQILKPELLEIPRLGAFNLHGSLLPRYRGAAPVQYSIWQGDELAGVTIFRIEPALDSGPMVGKVSTRIGPQETSGELMLRLADLCVPLTLEVLEQLEQGSAVFEQQDAAQVVFSPKISRDAGVIDWSAAGRLVDCQIRAMQPWPKASSVLQRPGEKDLRCLIQRVRVVPDTPGSSTGPHPGVTRVQDGELQVRSGDGWLVIEIIQPEGKRAMEGMAFANGYHLSGGGEFLSAVTAG